MTSHEPDQIQTDSAKQKMGRRDGCLFIANVAAGFMGFLIIAVLAIVVRQKYWLVYLGVALIGSILMFRRNSLRACALGIILGLALTLLLLAICGVGTR